MVAWRFRAVAVAVVGALAATSACSAKNDSASAAGTVGPAVGSSSSDALDASAEQSFQQLAVTETQAPTEAPTEAPTVAPTEAPTEAPTVAPTEAPVATETPAPSVLVVIEDTAATPSSASASAASTASVNWVGPTIGDATDSACYRETHSMGSSCPLGYSDDSGSCWAQCPLAYPVECGMECIPQNDDCALEVLTKIASVATVAINAATAGVFGQISTASKAVQLGVSCGKQLFTVSKSIISYMRTMQTSAANSTDDQIIETLTQADVVLVDLPVAVATCLGLEVPTDTTDMAKSIISGAEEILKVIVTQSDEIVSSAESFISIISNVTAGASVSSLGGDDVASLTELIDSGSDCGANLKTLTDKAVIAVAQIRSATPDISTEDVRAAVSTSDLVLNQIPTVTNECMGELLDTVTSETAYATRDSIRKTFGVILEQLITTGTTDNGTTASTLEYVANIADMGLGVISTFDPTGIAAMVAEFIQPICGPTAFLGEIDDGSLADALGLTTIDDAFSGSYGTWTKAGDGVVTIIFESTDEEDVTVVIHSGGDTVEEVDVASGETVTWTSTVSELQDKTLYLDRWRPGFLGLPGSGGGSLLMWIPRSSSGGHVELHAKINVS